MDEQAQFQAILDELNRRAALDPQLRQIMKKIGKGKATFEDTALLSQRMGNMLGEVFGANVLDIPVDTRESICTALLKQRYSEMNETLTDVQEALDEPLGVHLTPKQPPFPSERVQQLAHALLDPTVAAEVIQRRADKPVATVAKSFHDDYIKVNSKLRNDLGLKPILQRFGTGCCAWCAAVAGKWRFGEQPDDVFRRHDNCDCVIIYDTQVLRGVKTEGGGRSKTWEEVDPSDLQTDPPKVFSQSEARDLQENALNRLTKPGQGDIIRERSKNDDKESPKLNTDGKSSAPMGSNLFSETNRRKLYENERIIAGNKYETAILYDSEGNRVFVKKGSSDSVTFTASELKQMKGCVLTHNHPNGSVFSPEDINILRRTGLTEIRACNSQGAYVLQHSGKWSDEISSLESIRTHYDRIMNEVGEKYRDMAAREGKSIIFYLDRMDQESLEVFSERFGLIFTWEGK